MTTRFSRFTLLSVFLLLSVALIGAPVLAQEAGEEAAEQPEAAEQTEEAREAADAWLALYDANDIEGTYETAADVFKEQVSLEDWEMQAGQVQDAVGELDGREFTETVYTNELPQAPAGDYMIVQYDTQYANMNVTEFVILLLEEGEWRLVGFNAQPQQ